MKSFGSQWLNDWEDSHEPVERVAPAPDPRTVILQELSPILSSSLAGQLADSILYRLRGYLRG